MPTPHVVATGFTSAFLGDERTLREFIVGDEVRRELVEGGKQAALYLINDSHDPLTFRQLRIAVNKSESLLKKFEPYCGRPIAEVPDPFGCHKGYAEHFADELMHRLRAIGIFPVLLDTYDAYRSGLYAPYVRRTLANYDEIRRRLLEQFPDFTAAQHLFRMQCSKCGCMDATVIQTTDLEEVGYRCERCHTECTQHFDEVRGKLSWKLDCAARWNLYSIDSETFAKSHFEDLGTIGIARFMSTEYYGGRLPVVVNYGDVQIDRQVSNKLLEILPPAILRALFATHRHRDLRLTKDFVENFCQKYQVRPGMSYTDYVRKNLSRDALHHSNDRQPQMNGGIASSAEADISDRALVDYGNRFSKLYYGRDYTLRLPDTAALDSVDARIVAAASGVVQKALSLRSALPSPAASRDEIRSLLLVQETGSEVYRFLRKLMRQDEGPNLATVLAIIPQDYLEMVHWILANCAPPRSSAELKVEAISRR